ncbi:MAG: NADH:ubiquinone reductase (Na(+)-transporting) subunit A [Myxococcota bacterium]
MTRRLRRLASGRLRIELHGGLDLGLPGAAGAPIESAGPLRSVALLGHDHPRARCSLRVQVGERVARGQTLFVDRRRPEIRFASPAAGLVRVARREQVHEPVVVEVEVDEADDLDVGPTFDPLDLERTRALGREGVIRRLLEAGEWPALRTRPFGDLADPDVIPDALFVRAMDSHPGAPRAVDVMADRAEDFRSGVAALAGLIEGPVYVCCDPGAALAVEDLERVRVVEFAGAHPAGLVGTHVQHLFPLEGGRRVWYTGHQEVLAIGRLFREGRSDPERVVAIGGPLVPRPRLVRTRLGARVGDFVRAELDSGGGRVVSGSLLSGRRAASAENHLGRYHDQVSLVREAASAIGGTPWPVPRRGRVRWFPTGRRVGDWTTALHGRTRAMLPFAFFDEVAPLRSPMTLLLRALVAGDFETARALGVLELEEEDVDLCSFVCPSKIEYGAFLRSALDALEVQAR